MDALDNPEMFQNSSVVQKSSETGIFSNKRLLVIKNGYLYYFSKVPKGYKNHVPNILTTFTDLPKSSIEIKTIQDIRLESAKSSSLIIKFFKKDMINRQDIRKSIDNQSFSAPQKKNTNELDEWKFTFTTVLQCRLWYNALIKLKDYFKKMQHNFKDFVTNFDPKRGSVQETKETRSQSDLKLSLANTSGVNSTFGNNETNMIKSQHRKTEPVKFDPSKFITVKVEKQSPLKTQKAQKQNEIKMVNSEPKQQKASKFEYSSTIKQQDQTSQNGYYPDISKKIEPQIPQSKNLNHNELKKNQSFKSSLKQSRLIEPINEEDELKIRQMEDQIRQQLQEEIRFKLQKQKQIEISAFRSQMKQKQNKIKHLEGELHKNQVLNQQKQRQIEDQKRALQRKIIYEQQKLTEYKQTSQKQISKYRTQHESHEANKITLNQRNSKQNSKSNAQQNKKTKPNESQNKNAQKYQRQWAQEGESYLKNQQNSSQIDQQINTKQTNINNDRTKPSELILMNELSVQTDEQDFPDNHQGSQRQLNLSKQLNFSKELNLSRELNLSKQAQIRNSFFSDYITSNRNTLRQKEVEDLVQDQALRQEYFNHFNYFYEQGRVFEQGISSDEKIQREVKLIQYVNYVRQMTTYMAQQYIADNKPHQSVNFEEGLFSFELACAPGKIINIGGQKKLIYSNKAHQNLKRKFKVYQKLQVQILKTLKKKIKYPVRVPLCTLIQYMGYTILAKLQLCNEEEQIKQKQKHLKHIISADQFPMLKLSKTVSSSQLDLYFLTVAQTFKVTDMQKSSQIKRFQTCSYSYFAQIQHCRKSNISICYQKLARQSCQDQDENSQVEQKQTNEVQIKTIRQLKKIFKSMEPYSSKFDKNASTSDRSEFVQNLLRQPQSFIDLIPSDTKLTDFKTRQGYFYWSLQFYLGIRILDVVNSNNQDPSYRLIPVTRSFEMYPLICYQYCEKIDRYLALNNIQSAESCFKLLKRISHCQIKTLLVQIKILLRKKQYALTEQKINLIRQILPLHDLRNIQINAHLIECYIFMGLETDALKQIRSSLEYVEYMFADRNNSFQYNLHLLMAQTLLKMGNLKESLKIYKNLLKQGKIEKEQILVSFGQILQSDARFSPNQTIPFLLQFIEELQSAQKKIGLHICLAKLYLRISRKDKQLYYLQTALKLCYSQRQYKYALEAYDLFLQSIGKQERLRLEQKQFLQKVHGDFFQNQQNCLKFNTLNMYQCIKTIQKTKQRQIVDILQKMLDQQQYKPESTFEVKEWQHLKGCITTLIGHGYQQNRSNTKWQRAGLYDLNSIDIQSLLVRLNQHLQTT